MISDWPLIMALVWLGLQGVGSRLDGLTNRPKANEEFRPLTGLSNKAVERPVANGSNRKNVARFAEGSRSQIGQKGICEYRDVSGKTLHRICYELVAMAKSRSGF